MTDAKFTTAEELISDSLDRAQKCLDAMYNPKEDKVDHTAIIALISHFNTAVLLEALRRADPTAADRMTNWLEDLHEDGSTTGELVYQWREQIVAGHQLTGLGGHDGEPTPPLDAVPFQLLARDDSKPLEVLAVTTSVPGLLVVQAISGGGELGEYHPLAGQWSIAHQGSGRLIAAPSYPLDIATAVAERLGTIGLDWTRPLHDLTDEPDGVRAFGTAVRHAFEIGINCRYCTDADHIPVQPWRTAPSTEAGAA